MADALNFVTTVVTLSAGVATKLVSRNVSRQYLAVQNTNTGSATITFQASPVAGAGLSLDPASAAGGQGGSWEWSVSVPTQPVYAISTAGTVLVVIEG